MKKTNEIKGKKIINSMIILQLVYFAITMFTMVLMNDMLYILNALLFFAVTILAIIGFIKING